MSHKPKRTATFFLRRTAPAQPRANENWRGFYPGLPSWQEPVIIALPNIKSIAIFHEGKNKKSGIGLSIQ